MTKRIKQFGGDKRVFLEDAELSNLSTEQVQRINDDEAEALEIIKEGFSTLTEQEMQAIALKCEIDPQSPDGRTYTDEKSAEIMGVTYETFTQAVLRAKKKLRKYAKENAGSSIYIESMLKGEEI